MATVEKAIVTFLREQTRQEFCRACVSRRLAIPLADVVAALTRLQMVRGFTAQMGRCRACRRLRLVAGFSPPSAVPGESRARVSPFPEEAAAVAPMRLRLAICDDEIEDTAAPGQPLTHHPSAIGVDDNDAMDDKHRLMIVRPGATDVYDQLHTVFAGQPRTRIIYDRRAGAEAPRPEGERRLPHDPTILASRGFFATRPRLLGPRQ